MEFVGLAFGLVGGAQMCLKLGNELIATFRSYQNAGRELAELMLRVDHQWYKAAATLQFLERSYCFLDPAHQDHLGRVLGVLRLKLQEAGQSTQAMLNYRGLFRRAKYALRYKETIEKTVQDLESWQSRFEPSFFLIARNNNPGIDAHLAAVEVQPVGQPHAPHEPSATGQLSTMKGLRNALRVPREDPGIMAILLPMSDFSAPRRPIYYSTSLMGYNAGTQRNVIINTIAPGADLERFERDIQELVRVFSRADPMTFGILTCLGVLRVNRSGNRTGFEVVFDFPGRLDQPKSLRMVLNEACGGPPTHSLGERFQLARQLAKSVMFVHSCSFVHKSIRPESTLLFHGSDSSLGTPFLVGFERFRPVDGLTLLTGNEQWNHGLYHHPSRQGRFPEEKYRMEHDIYSLGVCLLEVGLWTSFVVRGKEGAVPGPSLNITEYLSMTDLRKRAVGIKNVLLEAAVSKLPAMMGAKYTEVVVSCLTCLDRGNDGFGETSELIDTDGILIGVRYNDVVFQKLMEIVV